MLTAAPQAIRALPPLVFQGVTEAYAHALHDMYLFAIPFAAVAFLAAWMLPEKPLRQERETGQSEGASSGAPTTVPSEAKLAGAPLRGGH